MAAPLPEWAELRCPATGAPLRREGDALVTEDGSRRYALVEGVPLLVDPSLSTFDPADYEPPSAGRPSLLARLRRRALRVAAWQPPISRNVGSEDNFARMRGLLREAVADRPARVLVIGGGQLGAGSEQLLLSAGVESVETDVVLGGRTQVVCDAQSLPFPDGAFDGAVAQAMLMCVPDPSRAVAELHRVLKPGGLVYSETGFLQQQTDAAHDFWRFTAQGHRRLMRWFEELDLGVQVGPGTALAWSVRSFARSLAGPSKAVQVLFARVAAVLCVWMPLLDPYLVRHKPAIDSASGTYFLGRRAEQPVSDREILSRYAGAQKDPYPGS